MKYLELTPMLWTEDLPATISFYKTILGFTLHEHNEDWGWASMGKDSVGIMFAKPNEHTPVEKMNFSGSFYFTVEDVDVLWEELKNKTNVFYPIDNFEYGMREFAIKDNNGYILQFGKEINP